MRYTAVKNTKQNSNINTNLKSYIFKKIYVNVQKLTNLALPINRRQKKCILTNKTFYFILKIIIFSI